MKMKWKGILFAVVISVYMCHITNAQKPPPPPGPGNTNSEYHGKDNGEDYGEDYDKGEGCLVPTFDGVVIVYDLDDLDEYVDQYGEPTDKINHDYKIYFSCTSGFQLSGPNNARCLHGTWPWDVNDDDNYRPQCSDVNECSESLHSCGTGERCENTQGSYKCVCARGYFEDDQGVCQDESCTVPEFYGVETEIIYKNAEQYFDELGAAKETLPHGGKIAFKCASGYTYSGPQFAECQFGVWDGITDIYQHIPRCTATPGYVATTTTETPSTTTTTEDYNECRYISCRANERCVKSDGISHCVCETGYYANGDCQEPTTFPPSSTTTTTTTEAPSTTTTNQQLTPIEHAGFMKEIMEVVNKYYIPRPKTNFRGYEYIYKKQRMTFNQAKKYCARQGGHVAHVNMKTQSQRKKIFRMFPGITNNPTWVGALQLGHMWFYINFRLVNHATFGWNHGEPNNWRRENCVITHRSGKVNNTWCNFRKAVLCEVKSN